MKKLESKKELWQFHQRIGQALAHEGRTEDKKSILPEKGCALIF